MRAIWTFCKIVAAIFAFLFVLLLAVVAFVPDSPEYTARRAAEAEARAVAAKAKAEEEAAAAKAKAEENAAAAKAKAEEGAAAAKAKAGEEVKKTQPPEWGGEVSEEYFKHVRNEITDECTKRIEKYALTSEFWGGDLRWTNRWFESKFDRWMTRRFAVITSLGDHAEWQNKFGNWVRVRYFCKYNPDKKEITGAALNTIGRFVD